MFPSFLPTFLVENDTPKEFNCFEEASQNPRFPTASLRARRTWGDGSLLGCYFEEVEPHTVKFNLSEVALLLYLYYPTFSSLRCGECGVL